MTEAQFNELMTVQNKILEQLLIINMPKCPHSSGIYSVQKDKVYKCRTCHAIVGLIP